MRGVSWTAAAAVLLALAAAGCSTPQASDGGETGEGGSCEERFGGALTPVVSLVPTLQDDPDVAMQRLASVVNDTPRDTPVVQGRAVLWTAERGILRWERDGNASVRVSHEAQEESQLGDPRALLEAAIVSFQPPFEIAYADDGLGTRAQQVVGGRPVEGAGASVEGRMLGVGPLLQLDPNVVLASDDEVLIPRALDVARCVDDDAIAGHEVARVSVGPYRLRDEVLVARVTVPSGPAECAGALLVDLHAVDATLAPPILCDAGQV